jgi:hypothetical protein
VEAVVALEVQYLQEHSQMVLLEHQVKEMLAVIMAVLPIQEAVVAVALAQLAQTQRMVAEHLALVQTVVLV